MYIEKLTDEDFEAFLSEGVILNYFGKKLKDVTLNIVRRTEYRVIININEKMNGHEVCKYSFCVSDFSLYYNDYSSLTAKVDIDKFYRFMTNKFGEKYLDDLLTFKDISPELVKEVYSLPTDWEDK